MEKIITIIIVLFHLQLFANDGAYYASGNQLIPINETDISVKKEILTLKKVKDQYVEVTVYYEFYNPTDDKELTVGFEAFSPMGDVDGTPINGMHPYMRDFTVEFNGDSLQYKVAYIKDSLRTKEGEIQSIKLKGDEGGNYVDFYYVYHFDATFRKGLNIVKHTYSYDLSGSVDLYYHFEYILTAANRWSNKQIDDFTLILDIGEFEAFNINKTFFDESKEWEIRGVAKTDDIIAVPNSNISQDALRFYIQSGQVIFKKLNFRPEGELFIYAQNAFPFDIKDELPFSYYQDDYIGKPNNEFEKKILKNLPFARRGYVFKNKNLQKYFEKFKWYIPNENYVPTVDKLTDKEKEWVLKWK